MSCIFRKGDTVILPKNGDLEDSGWLPHWGGKYGKVTGKVRTVELEKDEYKVHVTWSTGYGHAFHPCHLKHRYPGGKTASMIESKLDSAFDAAKCYKVYIIFAALILTVCYFASSSKKAKAAAEKLVDKATSKAAKEIAGTE